VERLKSAAIATGAIGRVSRRHRSFHEEGYHMMYLLRHHAGGEPTSVLGIAHESPVAPHMDRMNRHHTQEGWSMGVNFMIQRPCFFIGKWHYQALINWCR
jgi:hypothetical protein